MAEGRSAYERSVLSEIRMLLDYVASCGTLDLSALSVQNPERPKEALSAGEILVWLDQIETDLRNRQHLRDADFAFLQLVRDAVSRLARPATGLTVAFTALVTGSRRSPGSESRATLAEEAYPALLGAARFMRLNSHAIPVMAILCTMLAIWVATEVAFGKAILGNLDGLRAQQTSISAEKVRLEEALDKETDVTPKLLLISGGNEPKVLPSKLFALCDRPDANAFYLRKMAPDVPLPVHPGTPNATRGDRTAEELKLYTSPEQRDVCERDILLAGSIFIVHQELSDFESDWPSMIGGVFALPAGISSSAAWVRSKFSSARAEPSGGTREAPDNKDKHEDVEFRAAPLLLVWGNYVLPIIFGLLGALMFVILDLYSKLKESRLDPRDNALSWLRLVLGLAPAPVSACL